MTFASPEGSPRASCGASPVVPPDPSTPDDDPLRALLRGSFGKEEFRPGQREIIEAVLAGEDVLGMLPTGGGKSLCYQLPALMLPGTVVVISPLIALMQDQLDNLPPDLAGRAAVVNSRLSPAEIEERLQGIASGELRLVFVAPERLPQWPFLHALRRAGLSLLVVDEAHCISLWGHDFRPDFFFISTALECLGRPQVLALTATATPQVQNEIGVRLGRHLRRVHAGVARPNLALEVRWCGSDGEKLSLVEELVRAEKGPAIVYARARDKCEELARQLRARRTRAIAYHAGLAEEREAAQRTFMEGKARVVCATEAFGMGIDKADVRLIVHYNLRKSVEDYWQEAGRAGRDGRSARCVLLASGEDRGFLEWSSQQDAITLPLLQEVYRTLQRLLPGGSAGRVAMEELEREAGQPAQSIRVALSMLEQCGWVRRFPDLPRSLWLRPTGGGDDAFGTFIGNAGLTPGMPVTLDPLGLCATTGVEPQALEAKLLAWRDARWLQVGTRGGRDLLLALLPPQEGRVHPRELVDAYQARQGERTAAMAAYAGLRRCRHSFIAQTFGVPGPSHCEACDNCLSPAKARTAESAARLGKNGTRPAKSKEKQRTGASGKPAGSLGEGLAGGTGVAPVAAQDVAGAARAVLLTLVATRKPIAREVLVRVLRGSGSTPAGLKECTTFGCLGQWPQRHVEALVTQTADAALIRLRPVGDEGEYAYHLTDRGRETLASGVIPENAGLTPVSRSADARPGARGKTAPARSGVGESAGPDEEALYHRLRVWRNEVARNEDVPAYRVLTNDTLLWLAQMRPGTPADLLDVPGIGAVKADRYGPALLDLLRRAQCG